MKKIFILLGLLLATPIIAHSQVHAQRPNQQRPNQQR